MLNNKKISVYLHLYYEQISKDILQQLSTVYNGDLFISLNENGDGNDSIVECANTLFPNQKHVVVNNMGSDQWGFYKNYKQNPPPTDWVLYIHDKKEQEKEWLEDLIQPFIVQFSKINALIENPNIGIISSQLRKNNIVSGKELIKVMNNSHKRNYLKILRAKETVNWIHVLLALKGITIENLQEKCFCAGNMFICRKNILDEIMNNLIIDEFFEPGYRPDGCVEHAMERFYFLLSEGLGFTNKYI